MTIKYILFDLDDTLYKTSAGLMQQISQRMNDYMITRLGIPETDVARVRLDYWEQYGTTLRGLYIERHIDPQAFLDYVHDIPIAEFLNADAQLDALLEKLPGRKFIFTNAPENHARRVLAALGIERHFERIFDINFIRYESKPAASAYERVLAALGARGDECLMIDDSARNLAPARALGMRTVWLDGKGVEEPHQAAEAIIRAIYEVAALSFD